MDWYVSRDGEQEGPFSSEQIRLLAETGDLKASDLVWKAGMLQWSSASEVPGLLTPPPLPSKSSPLPTKPPPLPSKTPPLPVASPPLPESRPIADDGSDEVLSYPMAERWPRFLARYVDMLLIGLPASFVAGILFAIIFDGFGKWIAQPGAGYWFWIVVLPAVLVIEAFLHDWFGTSPGKALLGLKVTSLRGERLGFEQYLRRNFALWPSGLALGVPLISLFTYVNQYGRLGRGLETSYDEKLGTRVFGRPIGWVRQAIAIAAVVLLLLLNAALSKM